MQTLHFRNTGIFYSTYGSPESPAVMLLHGYLESMDIWIETAGELQDEFFIITPDLPGHGLSGVYSEIHTMEDMAEAVKMILDELNIQQVHLTGHSMGGYVTLAFRELYPGRLLSFTLFHSHCFADPEEKKINREREIELIRSGKKEMIVNTNIPKLFADRNLEKFSNEIAHARDVAIKTPDEGIISVLNGMKNRKDRCYLLKQGGIPGLLITGCHDNLIPARMSDSMMSFSKDMKRVDLRESGHMGLLEEKDTAVKELSNFFRHIKASPSL